ncbi:hypothetical protein, partial [Streptomyces sp. NPDC056480]|uniref:hypothetical protein n=1 Tax=Streptomyces sp. NPDC056480 TaxID=3345833 RepID=UPI0036949F21
ALRPPRQSMSTALKQYPRMERPKNHHKKRRLTGQQPGLMASKAAAAWIVTVLAVSSSETDSGPDRLNDR